MAELQKSEKVSVVKRPNVSLTNILHTKGPTQHIAILLMAVTKKLATTITLVIVDIVCNYNSLIYLISGNIQTTMQSTRPLFYTYM